MGNETEGSDGNMNKKPANQRVVPKSIGLDPDVLRLFMKLPEGERSRIVNDILRRNLHAAFLANKNKGE